MRQSFHAHLRGNFKHVGDIEFKWARHHGSIVMAVAVRLLVPIAVATLEPAGGQWQ